MLQSIGNNDGYHYQAVDESQKSTFYGFLHSLWFTDYPGNAKLVDSVTDTFMNGGYYRADVSDSVSVLNFNFEYMDKSDDTSFQANEATAQLSWLEAQLATAASSGRKFIIIGHVYAGARHQGEQLWHTEFVQRYF